MFMVVTINYRKLYKMLLMKTAEVHTKKVIQVITKLNILTQMVIAVNKMILLFHT